MNKKEILIEFRRYSGLPLLTEDDNKPAFDFDTLPDDVKDTLGWYDGFVHNTFDWNSKMRELRQPAFSNWLRGHTNEVLTNNIGKIINMTIQDMALIRRKKIAEQKLKYFEELIRPALSNDALMPALTKFEEDAILNQHATPEMIQRAFDEAKNVMDAQGNIDSDKMEKSTLFAGGDFGVPSFRAFAEKNPEYKGVFNDWKKLFDEDIQLTLKNFHGYRASSFGDTSFPKIKKLRDTLIQIRKTHL